MPKCAKTKQKLCVSPCIWIPRKGCTSPKSPKSLKKTEELNDPIKQSPIPKRDPVKLKKRVPRKKYKSPVEEIKTPEWDIPSPIKRSPSPKREPVKLKKRVPRKKYKSPVEEIKTPEWDIPSPIKQSPSSVKISGKSGRSGLSPIFDPLSPSYYYQPFPAELSPNTYEIIDMIIPLIDKPMQKLYAQKYIDTVSKYRGVIKNKTELNNVLSYYPLSMCMWNGALDIIGILEQLQKELFVLSREVEKPVKNSMGIFNVEVKDKYLKMLFIQNLNSPLFNDEIANNLKVKVHDKIISNKIIHENRSRYLDKSVGKQVDVIIKNFFDKSKSHKQYMLKEYIVSLPIPMLKSEAILSYDTKYDTHPSIRSKFHSDPEMSVSSFWMNTIKVKHDSLYIYFKVQDSTNNNISVMESISKGMFDKIRVFVKYMLK